MSPKKPLVKKPKASFWKVHYLGIAVNFPADELQILLQVVGERRHQNVFVSIFNSPGVLSSCCDVNQRAKHRLYARTSALR